MSRAIPGESHAGGWWDSSRLRLVECPGLPGAHFVRLPLAAPGRGVGGHLHCGDFCAAKQIELAQYRANVSDWEIEQYLEKV